MLRAPASSMRDAHGRRRQEVMGRTGMAEALTEQHSGTI